MEIRVDSDIQSVLEFMQSSIPAAKLTGVAEGVCQIGRLLWERYPQEPCVPVMLNLPKTGSQSRSQVDASESSLAL